MKRRKADYERIERILTVSKEHTRFRKATDQSDATILFGDLNYRMNTDLAATQYMISHGLVDMMVGYDQLSQIRRRQEFMHDFVEGEIRFAPTFKFDVAADNYLWTESRIPSYTDRVLYKNRQKGVLRLESYDSNNLLKSSDHRPVFAQFVCQIQGNFREDAICLTQHEALRRIRTEEVAFGKCRRATCTIV